MKKPLYLISCAVVSTLLSQGATLVSEWDGFTADGKATAGDLSFNFGSSSVNADGVLNVAAATGLANRPTVDLSSAGLSLYKGLTISLEVKGATANTNMLGLASSENVHLFAAGTDSGSHGLFLFDGSSSKANTTGNTATLGVTSTTSSIITITTGWDGSNVVFNMYENGTLVASGTANNSSMAQQALTTLALGGWAGTSNNSTTAEDVSRLAIYDGAMTAGEVQAAYEAWTVPEPATASLGLLGLAALLLRRRR